MYKRQNGRAPAEGWGRKKGGKVRPECGGLKAAYLPASFFAISSTIFGRRSAITLSTMRAIVLASVADADAAPSAAATAAMAFGASSDPDSACFAASTTSLFAAAPAGAVWI